MKHVLTCIAVIFLLFIIIIPVIAIKTGSEKTSPEETVPEETVLGKIAEANSVQEISNLINGTTWHYTEDLKYSDIGCWLKVKFHNGSYTTYYAQPMDGEWTEGGRGTYEVGEGRFRNTGGHYYRIDWKGDMKFNYIEIPCEMTLSISKDGFRLHVGSSLMRQANALTMGANASAYYNATHNQTYSGKMEFGDYTWN